MTGQNASDNEPSNSSVGPQNNNHNNAVTSPVTLSAPKNKNKEDERYRIAARFDTSIKSGGRIAPGDYDYILYGSLEPEAKKRIDIWLDPRNTYYWPANHEFNPFPLPLIINNGQAFVYFREIDRGGFGIVYEAYDLKTGKAYAIKEMDYNTDENTDETQMDKSDAGENKQITMLKETGLMREQNQLFTASIPQSNNNQGSAQTKAFLPLKLIKGSSLQDYIDKNSFRRTGKKMNLASFYECILLMLDTIDSVNHLHAQGYVHHDLKPDNIIADITKYRARVIDLDQVPEHDTLTDFATWTALYSEYFHEGVKNDYVDYPYDIYSLGMIMQFLFGILYKDPVKGFFSRTQGKLNKICEPDVLEFLKEIYELANDMRTSKEKRKKLQDAKNVLLDLAQRSHDEIIDQQIKLRNIGIVCFNDFIESIKINKDKVTCRFNSEFTTALRALDGFYLYIPDKAVKECGDYFRYSENKEKSIEKQIIDFCRKHKLNLKGIVNYKNDTVNTNEKNDAKDNINNINNTGIKSTAKGLERLLDPIRLDGARAQIERLEAPYEAHERHGLPKPQGNLNAYFYVTSDEYRESIKSGIASHGFGFLQACSANSTAHYKEKIARQANSIKVTDASKEKAINLIKARVTDFEAAMDKLNQTSSKDADADAQRKIDLYTHQVKIGKKLITKITEQANHNELTYETLIQNLRAYRYDLKHANMYKYKFYTFFKLTHSTRSAGMLKELEKELHKKDVKERKELLKAA